MVGTNTYMCVPVKYLNYFSKRAPIKKSLRLNQRQNDRAAQSTSPVPFSEFHITNNTGINRCTHRCVMNGSPYERSFDRT